LGVVETAQMKPALRFPGNLANRLRRRINLRLLGLSDPRRMLMVPRALRRARRLQAVLIDPRLTGIAGRIL